ncbi:MAG: DUF3570 domain-containing protein [Pseudomonadota bacterium]
MAATRGPSVKWFSRVLLAYSPAHILLSRRGLLTQAPTRKVFYIRHIKPVNLTLKNKKFIFLVGWLLSGLLHAAVLPEQRMDVLYHSYDGGGMEINGPAVLVRKNLKEKYTISGHHYIDKVNGASVDVMSYASPYVEERQESSVNLGFLKDKSLFSVGYLTSAESDYDANSVFFDVSQDFFGDLSTISLGFSRGWDEVGNSSDENFSKEVGRRNYRIGFSQILTPKTILNLGFENVNDEGFLNNPYRQVRYFSNTNFYEYQPEIYPETRTSQAYRLGVIHYLNYGASLQGSYRLFNDTWGIKAHTYEMQYQQRVGWWTYSGKLRFYQQNNANFFSDLFPYEDFSDYLARDKELSTFQSQVVGVGVSYRFKDFKPRGSDHMSINFFIDHLQFDYDDFRDATVTEDGSRIDAEDQPYYQFSANVARFFISLWY